MGIGLYCDKGSIIARFRKQYNGKQISLVYFPGIRLEGTTTFDAKKSPNCSDPNIEKKLINLRQAINDVLDENDTFTLSNDSFGKLVNEKLKHRNEANKKGDYVFKKTAFLPFAQKFAAYKKANKDKVGNKDYLSIGTTVRMIPKFAKVYKAYENLTFEQIDRKFNEDFLTYLQDNLDSSDNYISKMFGNLKQILDKATKEGINTKLDYLLFEKKKRRAAYNVYLSDKQLETVYNLKLAATNDPMSDYLRLTGKTKGIKGWTPDQYRECVLDMIRSLDNVRKLLLIGCWTGLRGGNFLNIAPKSQIFWNENTKMLEVSAIANKGTGFVSIPAHWTVVEIYESSWPYKISLKTYNEQVKVIGRLAGLNQPVLLEKYKGGKNYKETKLFYELMASHTCRRSFCSNLLIAGLPIQTIMAFSGHSTEKSFNIYTAYVTTEIRTAKASEHAIWKKPKQEPINNKEFSGVNE